MTEEDRKEMVMKSYCIKRQFDEDGTLVSADIEETENGAFYDAGEVDQKIEELETLIRKWDNSYVTNEERRIAELKKTLKDIVDTTYDGESKFLAKKALEGDADD